MHRTLFVLWIGLSAFLLLMGEGAQAGTIDPKLQARVQAVAPDEPLPVIVTLTKKADVKSIKDKDKRTRRRKIIESLRQHADGTQKSLIDWLKSQGVTDVQKLWLINGLAFTLPAGLVDELAQRPGVDLVRLDEQIGAPALATATAPATATSTPAEWNPVAIRAPEVWDLGDTGQGVVVANMDTGVDVDHPDLSGRWRGGTNSWYDPYKQHKTTPTDVNGHGTQTMGLVVGGTAGGTAIGVAPGARWIAVKIFNDSNVGTLSAIHLGFQWLLDPDKNAQTNDAADVVNNSWDIGVGCNTEFQQDIGVLKTAQIAVVFSGGNSGPNASSSVSPANNPGSFAVGSVDIGSAIAPDSSRGPSACDGGVYPQVVAPGVDVRSTDLSYGGFPFYITQSGTSVAASHVAGAMACSAPFRPPP